MILYTDGGCSGNDVKDIASRKLVMVVMAADGDVISERTSTGGSNNIAELEAVRDAVMYSVKAGSPELEIRTDSKNNQAWVFGNIGQKLNDRQRVLGIRSEIDSLRTQIKLTLVWVPRESNIAGHYIESKYGL